MVTKQLNMNVAASSAPGELNAELAEVKEKLGLPKWNDLSEELHVLAERHGVGWADELKQKVDLYKRYQDYQVFLYQNFISAGVPQVSAVHNTMDLQMKLFELEEKIKAEGGNPLESDEYMKARELLSKELQFINRYKLDIATFQANLQKAKIRTNDDAVFTVEAEVKQ